LKFASRGYSSLPLYITCFTSAMALVISMSRGQASVQLKAVLQRQTPLSSFNTSRRSEAAVSRLSKMKRCALTIAAGPTYFPFA